MLKEKTEWTGRDPSRYYGKEWSGQKKQQLSTPCRRAQDYWTGSRGQGCVGPRGCWWGLWILFSASSSSPFSVLGLFVLPTPPSQNAMTSSKNTLFHFAALLANLHPWTNPSAYFLFPGGCRWAMLSSAANSCSLCPESLECHRGPHWCLIKVLQMHFPPIYFSNIADKQLVSWSCARR